jgi:probable H4MPT-linked C1 transfer pathway protein
LAGELVYTGVGRTPLCAVTPALPYRGKSCPVAAELFATTADVYVVLREIAEQPEATWTADGRPLTRAFAQERLARMICADATTFDEQDAHAAAEAVRVAQFARLRSAVEQVATGMHEPPHGMIVCGTGEFLAARLVEDLFGRVRLVSLTTELGTDVSTCGPAHALAVLAREAEGP